MATSLEISSGISPYPARGEDCTREQLGELERGRVLSCLASALYELTHCILDDADADRVDIWNALIESTLAAVSLAADFADFAEAKRLVADLERVQSEPEWSADGDWSQGSQETWRFGVYHLMRSSAAQFPEPAWDDDDGEE